MKKLLTIIFFVLVLVPCSAKYRMNYHTLDNVNLSAEAHVARCFMQDSLGLIWIGTDKGLYSYDGYDTQQHYQNGSESNVQIHCMLSYVNNLMFMGTDQGVLVYDCRTDEYVPTYVDFPKDVRAMFVEDNRLWVGSTGGLYCYDQIDDLFVEGKTNAQARSYLLDNLIYSLTKCDNKLWVGTYFGLYVYAPQEDSFELVNFNNATPFVNTLLADDTRHALWIGTTEGLYHFDIEVAKAELVGSMVTIKTLAEDCDGNIIIGTDNGLYIYLGDERFEHFLHDSREPKSLTNNVVWNIYRDRFDNVWFGTDYGVSVASANSKFEYTSISQLTGEGYGNQLFTINRDSRGNLWFGGNNGLIRSQHFSSDSGDTQWYRMSEGRWRISHNRIRDIYEDSDNNLWVATDNEIQLYDYKTETFVQHSVVDTVEHLKSSWAYQILEDDRQRYWIATCMSGVLVADKDRMLNSSQTNALMSFTVKNGLSGNFIDMIVRDKATNSVWVLVHLGGIDRISLDSNKVTNLNVAQQTGGNQPSYMICDSENTIWAGFRGGVMRIDPTTSQMQTVKFGNSLNAEVLCMTETEDKVWVSTTEGVWIVGKSDAKVQHINLTDRIFTSLYFDRSTRTVFLGGMDGYATASLSAIQEQRDQSPIIISRLFVNDTPYSPKRRGECSIRYTDCIELAHDQNNIIIELSDLTYSQEGLSAFVYRFSENTNWIAIRQEHNTISLSNLPFGSNKLYVGRVGIDGLPSDDVKEIEIVINYPWYYSTLARIVYVLLAVVLTVWIVNFFRIRNRLRFERIEKENALRQAEAKMKFYTDISHEFKTPLSLIVAPIAQMLTQQHSEQDRRYLEMIHTNAMKLNSLIHQAIDYYRNDTTVEMGLIASNVEVVEFARTIFSSYQESMKGRELEFIFTTNIERLNMKLDAVKMESVLNNLISNACKYTESGDSIMLTLVYGQTEGMLEIKVSDSGVGIPKEDTPYVFQRFFKSPTNSKNREGTGVGLSLVKNYVELHGGTVSVASGENNGTTFTVLLPAECQDTVEEKEFDVVANDAASNRPLIAVVEDNEAIAGLLCEMLKDKYRCVVAHNGKTGLKLCTELLPDLIIADVMMPIMDGMEMCHRLKQNVYTSVIPIIILTAIESKQTELQSISLNVDAFISKPFEPDIVCSRVNQLIDKRREMERKIRIETISAPKEIEAQSYEEKFLCRIINAIEDNIADPDLNVNSLCSLLDMSQKQVYRKCKQLLGLTPVDYIKSIRLKKAAILLQQQKFTVSEVMYMVGFSNHSYFSKCFQAEFGKTPQQFKKDKELSDQND